MLFLSVLFAATAPIALYEFYDPHVRWDNLCEVRALLGCHFLNANDGTVIAEMNELEANRQKAMTGGIQTLLSSKTPASKTEKNGRNLYGSLLRAICTAGTPAELEQIKKPLNSFVHHVLLRKDKNDELNDEAIESMMNFVSVASKMVIRGHPKLAEFITSFDEDEIHAAYLLKTMKKLPDFLKGQVLCDAAKTELEGRANMLCANLVRSLPINSSWFSSLPMILLVRKGCAVFPKPPTGTVAPSEYASTVLMFLNCNLSTAAPIKLCLPGGLPSDPPCYAAVLEVYSADAVADANFGNLETGLFPSALSCFDRSSLLHTFSRFIGSTLKKINGVSVKSHWTIINGTGNFADFYVNSGIDANRIKKF